MTAERGLLRENIRLLHDLRLVLRQLSGELYVNEESSMTSSVAKHVRHVLNHYEKLVGMRDSVIDYETRERGTAIEKDIAAALSGITALVASLESWMQVLPDATRLRVERWIRLADGRLESLSYPSTLARELDFVHQHTVHHFAIIAVILRAQGFDVARDFGMSPATLRFQATHASSG